MSRELNAACKTGRISRPAVQDILRVCEKVNTSAAVRAEHGKSEDVCTGLELGQDVEELGNGHDSACG